MIIDANTHISDTGFWFDTNKIATIEDLLFSMRQSGISKSLILPLPGVISNSAVDKIEEKYSDLIIAGSYFNPKQYNSFIEAINEFNQEIVLKNKRIVKFHNRLCKYGFYDENFFKVLEFNNSLIKPIPIAICGIFHDGNSNTAIVPPTYIYEIVKKFSNTNFLILHGAGSWIFKTAEMIRSLKNVHLDLSFTISRYKGSSVDLDIRWLSNNFDKRLIWGSDSPEISQKQALEDFYSVAGRLTSDKIDNILGNNIRSLLDI